MFKLRMVTARLSSNITSPVGLHWHLAPTPRLFRVLILYNFSYITLRYILPCFIICSVFCVWITFAKFGTVINLLKTCRVSLKSDGDQEKKWAFICRFFPLPSVLTAFCFPCAGHKYYYNTKTHISQWEHPKSSQLASQHHHISYSGNASSGNQENRSSDPKKCIECSGWGLGLVQTWGYCNHCTR